MFYPSVGAVHVFVVAVAVCVASRGGCAWVRLVCSCVRVFVCSCVRVFVCSCVCCLSWCPACGHLPAGPGCVPLSPCSFRSLCFPESVSARMGSGPSQSVIWHVYCEYIIILYNLQP